MTPNDTISVSVAVLVSVVSLIIAAAGLYLSARKQKKEDTAEREKAEKERAARRQKEQESENQRELKLQENFLKVNMKLDTFCETMQQMVVKSDKNSEELRKIREQLIEDRGTLKDHEKRIASLEAWKEKNKEV